MYMKSNAHHHLAASRRKLKTSRSRLFRHSYIERKKAFDGICKYLIYQLAIAHTTSPDEKFIDFVIQDFRDFSFNAVQKKKPGTPGFYTLINI